MNPLIMDIEAIRKLLDSGEVQNAMDAISKLEAERLSSDNSVLVRLLYFICPMPNIDSENLRSV